jgi:hypothetical protein
MTIQYRVILLWSIVLKIGITSVSVRPEPVEACPERLPWQAVEGGRSSRRKNKASTGSARTGLISGSMLYK